MLVYVRKKFETEIEPVTLKVGESLLFSKGARARDSNPFTKVQNIFQFAFLLFMQIL